MPSYFNPMVDLVIWAMEGRGTMSLPSIYREVKAQADKHGRTLAPNWEAQIRETLQAYCPTSPEYEKRGRQGDFFVHPRRGYWSCKATSGTTDDFVV